MNLISPSVSQAHCGMSRHLAAAIFICVTFALAQTVPSQKGHEISNPYTEPVVNLEDNWLKLLKTSHPAAQTSMFEDWPKFGWVRMAKRANLDRALSRWKFGRIMDGRIRILKHKKKDA